MTGIFISYRRDDTDVAAGRLADDLSHIFGPDAIFRDVDKLEPGEDYVVALDRALGSCSAFIAMIGPRWSSITDKAGRRRLEDSEDWVRVEIGRALKRNIRVIPILVSGTVMPEEAEVPSDLKPLLKRQAFELDDRHWRQDLELLAQALGKIPGIGEQRPKSAHVSAATAGVKLIGSKQWFLISPQMTVFIDNEEVARMKLSDEVTVNVKPGSHTMYLKMFMSASNTLTFDLATGQTRSFSVNVRRATGALGIEAIMESAVLH